MKIQLRLMGMLQSKTPADQALDVPADATIEDVLTALDIPTDSVHVYTVNGQLVRDRAYRLNADDQLCILPPVGGG